MSINLFCSSVSSVRPICEIGLVLPADPLNQVTFHRLSTFTLSPSAEEEPPQALSTPFNNAVSSSDLVIVALAATAVAMVLIQDGLFLAALRSSVNFFFSLGSLALSIMA